MTTPTKTIPVPVEVLQGLLATAYDSIDDCCAFCGADGRVHKEAYDGGPCPIPALRDAVEESEKR